MRIRRSHCCGCWFALIWVTITLLLIFSQSDQEQYSPKLRVVGHRYQLRKRSGNNVFASLLRTLATWVEKTIATVRIVLDHQPKEILRRKKRDSTTDGLKIEGDCTDSTCVQGTCSEDRTRCICADGFTGDHCQYNINECLSNPCKNEAMCLDGVNRYYCDCREGWTGDDCSEDIDECSSSPCYGRGDCLTPSVGMFVCRCQPGFYGINCENDIKECRSHPCQNGGSCVEGLRRYVCICAAGFSGTHCEEDMDECETNPCQNDGLCRDQINGFLCECHEGYRGASCEEKIDACKGITCQNGGKCVEGIGRSYCSCQLGFEGDFCETQSDECRSWPCQNGGTCLDLEAEYECMCADGFDGPHCETNINECMSQPCQNDGRCIDEVNRYFCTCLTGYIGDRCEVDVDECASKPCANEGRCVDEVADFSCVCKEGYQGKICNQEINECDSSPCLNGGTCEDQTQAFQCNCADGYHGLRCEIEVNECSSAPCKNGGRCINLVNNYVCECTAGYGGSQCEIDEDECESNPCKNGGTCVDGPSSFTCLCSDSYDGQLCERKIKLCGESTCLNGGECKETENNFFCECSRGYDGSRCQMNIDDCKDQPCENGGICIDGVSSFTCLCREGYLGVNCNDTAEADADKLQEMIFSIVPAAGTLLLCLFAIGLVVCCLRSQPAAANNLVGDKSVVISNSALGTKSDGFPTSTEIPINRLEQNYIPEKISQKEDTEERTRAQKIKTKKTRDSKRPTHPHERPGEKAEQYVKRKKRESSVRNEVDTKRKKRESKEGKKKKRKPTGNNPEDTVRMQANGPSSRDKKKLGNDSIKPKDLERPKRSDRNEDLANCNGYEDQRECKLGDQVKQRNKRHLREGADERGKDHTVPNNVEKPVPVDSEMMTEINKKPRKVEAASMKQFSDSVNQMKNGQFKTSANNTISKSQKTPTGNFPTSPVNTTDVNDRQPNRKEEDKPDKAGENGKLQQKFMENLFRQQHGGPYFSSPNGIYGNGDYYTPRNAMQQPRFQPPQYEYSGYSQPLGAMSMADLYPYLSMTSPGGFPLWFPVNRADAKGFNQGHSNAIERKVEGALREEKNRPPVRVKPEIAQPVKDLKNALADKPPQQDLSSSISSAGDLMSPWQPVWKYNFPHILMEDTQLDKGFEVDSNRKIPDDALQNPTQKQKLHLKNTNNGRLLDYGLEDETIPANHIQEATATFKKTFLKEEISMQVKKLGRKQTFTSNNDARHAVASSPKEQVVNYSRHFTPPSPDKTPPENERKIRQLPMNSQKLRQQRLRSYVEKPLAEQDLGPKTDDLWERTACRTNVTPRDRWSFEKPENWEDFEEFGQTVACDHRNNYVMNDFGLPNPHGMSRENAFVDGQR